MNLITKDFVKPNDQSQACLSYGVARKGRMKFNYLNQNTIMKKIAYQAPVIKTLTMEYLMQAASGNGVTGTGAAELGSGGIDEDGTIDPDAKAFGNSSVWDD